MKPIQTPEDMRRECNLELDDLMAVHLTNTKPQGTIITPYSYTKNNPIPKSVVITAPVLT